MELDASSNGRGELQREDVGKFFFREKDVDMLSIPDSKVWAGLWVTRPAVIISNDRMEAGVGRLSDVKRRTHRNFVSHLLLY